MHLVGNPALNQNDRHTHPAPPQYLARLKEWVLSEKGDRTLSDLSNLLTRRLYDRLEKIGSDRLAAIGCESAAADISVQLLNKWARVGEGKGRLVQKQPLEGLSNFRIGILRGYAAETAEADTIYWLYTGIEPNTVRLQPVMGLAEYIEVAPLDEVAIALTVGVRRMNAAAGYAEREGVGVSVESKEMKLSDFLRSKMVKGGLDPSSEEGLTQLGGLIPTGRNKKPLVALDTLRDYVDGTAATIKPADLGLLASAVRQLLAQYPEEQIWNQETLGQILREGDRTGSTAGNL